LLGKIGLKIWFTTESIFLMTSVWIIFLHLHGYLLAESTGEEGDGITSPPPVKNLFLAGPQAWEYFGVLGISNTLSILCEENQR
jgi:hypothetical protein